MFSIDANSGVPIYRQVLEQIQRVVISGLLRPGDELPSVREVATRHAVNPMTISKAYALAEAEGLLVRQRGKPMRVAPRQQTHSLENARVARLEPLVSQIVEAAKQLKLDKEDIIDVLNTHWRDS